MVPWRRRASGGSRMVICVMGPQNAIGMGTFELPSLLERICVRPPYFALKDLEMCGSALRAVACAEVPTAGELGPMTAAELGRHAAIAGLCRAALSQTDERRRYYLAQRAECTFEPSDAQFGSEVAFRAELAQLDKRQARARIAVTQGASPLVLFDITYTILTEPAFARLFGARRQATLSRLESFLPRLEGETARDATSAAFKVAHVPAEACAGHFDDFPVLPVAVLMGQLSQLAGLTLGAPNVPYRIRRGSVSAKDLCWAGEPASFEVELADMCGTEASFDCTARAGMREVGRMRLALETI
jgi:hypothetical protein